MSEIDLKFLLQIIFDLYSTFYYIFNFFMPILNDTLVLVFVLYFNRDLFAKIFEIFDILFLKAKLKIFNSLFINYQELMLFGSPVTIMIFFSSVFNKTTIFNFR